MRPSELQSALRAHPGVREVAIVSHEGASGEKKLIAYVVTETGYWEQVLAGTKEERRRLEKWRKTFDLMQFGRGAASSAVAFDVAGWNSTYTRQPIPAEEMREWVATTVTEILALRPKQVLEIGCGTGLVLLRMAPRLSTNSGHAPEYCRTLQQSFIRSATDDLSLLEVEDHVARAHDAHAVRN